MNRLTDSRVREGVAEGAIASIHVSNDDIHQRHDPGRLASSQRSHSSDNVASEVVLPRPYRVKSRSLASVRRLVVFRVHCYSVDDEDNSHRNMKCSEGAK